MPYRIAGIDVHKKMLAVVVSDVEVEGEYHFERCQFATLLEIKRCEVLRVDNHTQVSGVTASGPSYLIACQLAHPTTGGVPWHTQAEKFPGWEIMSKTDGGDLE